MFAIICLNVMLLISCWYLIAENQKNKSKINGLEDDLNKAIKRLSALEEEGVTQKSWFHRNRFCRVTPAKFIRYLKSFYKVNLDINKPLRLWIIIYTLLKFRFFRSAPKKYSINKKKIPTQTAGIFFFKILLFLFFYLILLYF